MPQDPRCQDNLQEPILPIVKIPGRNRAVRGWECHGQRTESAEEGWAKLICGQRKGRLIWSLGLVCPYILCSQWSHGSPDPQETLWEGANGANFRSHFSRQTMRCLTQKRPGKSDLKSHCCLRFHHREQLMCSCKQCTAQHAKTPL